MFNFVDNKKIGDRIREARVKCELSTQGLADLIPKNPSKEPGHKPTITRQAVEFWEKGKPPKWAQIGQLAKAFAHEGRPEYGEQWILFGEHAQQTKYLVENVSPEEFKLLMAYRRANDEGKQFILRDVDSLSEKYADQGRVRQLRPVNNKPR